MYAIMLDIVSGNSSYSMVVDETLSLSIMSKNSEIFASGTLMFFSCGEYNALEIIQVRIFEKVSR